MSETRKLYYEDVYQKEFTAEVLECRETDRGYEVVLDQTAFYPVSYTHLDVYKRQGIHAE